jgi:hypothetical protein
MRHIGDRAAFLADRLAIGEQNRFHPAMKGSWAWQPGEARSFLRPDQRKFPATINGLAVFCA